MSYPRNAATPKAVTVGPLVKVSDGSLLAATAGVAVRVDLDGGGWGAGGGTIAVDATSSTFTYAPTQAETNGDVLKVALYIAGYVSISANVIMDPLDLAVNTTKIGGTAQTARDLGASVLLSPGTGTGQLTITSGVVSATVPDTQKVDLNTIKTQAVTCGAAVTVRASVGAAAAPGAANGMLVGGANAATTFASMVITGTLGTGAVTFNGLAITNALSVGTTTTLTGAVSAPAGIAANITGNLIGTVTTVTTLTNLPAAPADWLAAAAVKADAVTKIQTGLSTLTQAQVSGGAYDLTHATYVAALKSGLGTVPASGNWNTTTPDNTTIGVAATQSTAAAASALAVQNKLPAGGAAMHAAGAAVAKSPATLDLAADATGAFSAAALAAAPSGGLTAQQTRDAMKLAPTAGAPATGSVDKHLDDISSLAGAGSETVTVTSNDASGNPLEGVAVWITSDSAGTNTVAGTLYSTTLGLTVFYLDPGSYYVWRQGGANWTNPQSLEVVDV